MLYISWNGAVNFAAAEFFLQTANRMDQSERIRHLQEQATRYISRSKCVDASLRTLIVQSKSSGGSAPASVALSCGDPAASYTSISSTAIPGSPIIGKACSGVATGKGTRGEFINILQSKQAAAICCDTETQGGVIVLPVPCIDMNAPPFTQQNMSNPYIPPCRIPGNEVYFPPKIYDGVGCTYTRITTPS